MRKLSISVAVLAATAAVACSFEVGTKPAPGSPQAVGGHPAAAPAAPAAQAPAKTGPGVTSVGRRTGAAAQAPVPVPPAAPAPAPAAPPAGMPVLVGTNVFGTGTPDPAGWKGSYFVIPPATQKLPALAMMTPGGVLFAKQLNVASTAMTGGFPGIDATRNQDFAIRWEAPLIVDTEADYSFRLVSDDGAVLSIDSTPIVDNDGQHTAAEKVGPVHLVKGTHLISVDYFQATGPVALQLFCTKAGGSEVVCPTHL